MATLDEACFGPRHQSWQEVERARAAEMWRGRYGEPAGALIHVPDYALYAPGDRLVAKTTDGQQRKGVVLRADHELGIIEVIYGNAE